MKKIRKDQFDKGLRAFYWPLMLFSKLIARKGGIGLVDMGFRFMKGKAIKGLRCEERFISSQHGGPDIRIRIFRPDTEEILPGMLYNHGGGYMLGIPELALSQIAAYIKKRPCVIVAPDYRKAIKDPYPAGFNDCYDTLLWMKAHADSLGMRSTKFVVAGHSAGGGLTAAVTLKACDTGDVDIAFQMPIYPMIDHRQNTESAIAMKGVPCWDARNNAFGWEMYLQNVQGEVPAYASPSLGTNYTHLPPTITFVGDMEPFKDETIRYIEALKQENIRVKFELFEGAFHAFETVAKDATISKKANQFQYDAFGEFYDAYLK